MIYIGVSIKQEGATPDSTVREANNIHRAAYQQLGELFWTENVPRRFTWSGGRMLGYAQRSPKYEKFKRRKYGHADPLVASGRSRDAATKIMDVKATSTRNNAGVKIKLHAPALNFKNPKSRNNVTPNEEVRRIADKEKPPLVRHLARFIRDGFDKLAQQKSQEKV